MTLERNKIYQIDCLDGVQSIPTGSVKLIVADPPYFLGMTHNGQKGSFVDLAICKPFYKILFNEYKKTIEIIEKIVVENSKPGDLVVDTFGGSGTTALVCRKTGRDFILFELDEENFVTAERRAALSIQNTMFNTSEDRQ